ncbi:MAG: triose-phosphate isomerase [Rhodospirillaceae bacterium]|jgi:triosephosphate isomerase (TIM)|nr:triose-phosphate isomerase [Rhodospirillaceae bacterium]
MRPLIAGNWKMNTLSEGAVELSGALVGLCREEGDPGADLLICPPGVLLHSVASAVAGSPVALGAQDCHPDDFGAHTGDINAAMIADAGCSHVIVGHSERRSDHGENDELVRSKAAAAHGQEMIAIICVGETLEQRDAGETLAVVSRQIAGSVPDGATATNTVIAYEPVWAIGTGRTPTIEQVGEVHDHMRAIITGKIDDAGSVRLLYGGSMNPGNAQALLAVENVNGGLIGGASLKADDFWAICRSGP